MKGYNQDDKNTIRLPRQHMQKPHGPLLFQDLVRKKGLEDMFFLDSAATSTEEIGNSAHRGTREKLRQAGISLSLIHI